LIGLDDISRGICQWREPLIRRVFPYKPLEVLGPEHEFSLISDELKILPVVDQVIKDYCRNIANFVFLPRSTFAEEFPLHIIEIKAKRPFKSPELFEESMQNTIRTLLHFLKKRHNACLLGTGMHPLLRLEDTGTRPFRKQVQELGKIFNLKNHGWLNIQSFQLNLPYSKEKNAIFLYHLLAHLCTYLPAISASSPICEGCLTPYVDFRLYHYKMKSQEIPSMAGNVIPEYISSFSQFRKEISGRFSRDLTDAGVSTEDFSDYINQRAAVFKFARKAVEVRVMDEQECIKSDVALSCFIKATLRGLIATKSDPLPHEILINDYNSIVTNGLLAKVMHPAGKTARQVCQYFFNLALEYAKEDEKKYLWIIEKRIKRGNLSELIRRRVLNKAQRTTFKEAIISVYSQLAECLSNNQPYF
jgi:gamma-glutamyl:cysteine ligase YbdK (ATP-grasp superfamily)